LLCKEYFALGPVPCNASGHRNHQGHNNCIGWATLTDRLSSTGAGVVYAYGILS
jgi:hypothetical protein